jgi:hypothetical protein
VGGLLSRYVAPTPVNAQTTPTPIKEVRAQSFALVDGHDNVIGTFRGWLSLRNAPGNFVGETVVLMDLNEKEIWRAGVSVKTLAGK